MLLRTAHPPEIHNSYTSIRDSDKPCNKETSLFNYAYSYIYQI